MPWGQCSTVLTELACCQSASWYNSGCLVISLKQFKAWLSLRLSASKWTCIFCKFWGRSPAEGPILKKILPAGVLVCHVRKTSLRKIYRNHYLSKKGAKCVLNQETKTTFRNSSSRCLPNLLHEKVQHNQTCMILI